MRIYDTGAGVESRAKMSPGKGSSEVGPTRRARARADNATTAMASSRQETTSSRSYASSKAQRCVSVASLQSEDGGWEQE